MKILIPIDFHKNSFAAYAYGLNLADSLNAEVTVLHVIYGSLITGEFIGFNTILTMEESVMRKMDFFMNEYPKEVGIELPEVGVRKEVRFGIPSFTVANYANDKDFDLVVMGTRDKHDILDRLLGSVSSIATKRADCPVLLIHENTEFRPINKIAFAFGEKGDLEEPIEKYVKLNQIIKAKTEFVHVKSTKDSDISGQKEAIVEELFDNGEPSFAFEILNIAGKSVRSALKDYCLFEKVDLLAMVRRDDHLFSKLFRKNHSVKMAQEFHLPVLVFHED